MGIKAWVKLMWIQNETWYSCEMNVSWTPLHSAVFTVRTSGRYTCLALRGLKLGLPINRAKVIFTDGDPFGPDPNEQLLALAVPHGVPLDAVVLHCWHELQHLVLSRGLAGPLQLLMLCNDAAGHQESTETDAEINSQALDINLSNFQQRSMMMLSFMNHKSKKPHVTNVPLI